MSAERVSYATCPLCEATCGLEITTRGEAVVKIRGDEQDVFSHGFICPKGASIGALHSDPDRVTTPLRKNASGTFEPVSWEAAFREIDERLTPLLAERGRNAAAVYLGNPSAHGFSSLVYGRGFTKALGTRNVFTASTVDQMPKQVAVGLMFGAGLSVPVPDIDRTDYLMILGANPMASNGSLLTAPDMRGRMRALRARGGRLVVVDPRRSRTAEEADEHVFIRPGGDAFLLAAMAHVIFEEGLDDLGTVGSHVSGLEDARAACARFAPGAVESACGVDAERIARLARELAAAERAAVYGRIGTCTQEFGTLASWLVDVLNTITGNLDRKGGAMFPKAAVGQTNSSGKAGSGRGVDLGRWHSRVRGAPEAFGELPAVCMAEEIETEGEGQVRALFTVAGNPVLSTPDGERLARALDSLDLMVSLDIYVNETTRHADFILPGPSPLRRSHYDIAFYQLSVRNIVNYSPPVLEPEPELPDEWVTLLRLMGIAAGQGPDADVEALDDFVAGAAAQREVSNSASAVAGREPAGLLGDLEPRRGPERLLDLMIRCGPFGDGFGARTDGPLLTLAKLEDAPHGIDLGALEPRVPEMLRTPSGKIELAPAPILADMERMAAAFDRYRNGSLVLIGRRQLRSNNSWMHNVAPLVRGKDRCTLWVNPTDAERIGLSETGFARVRNETGDIELPVEITDAIMAGVVSIPHGWGHDLEGVELSVAREHAGVNSNLLAGTDLLDPLSGNAVLNGIPVELEAA
ncbi:MAG: molybdopterin-dependent oxidoreductase [Thermoleophilaceae bacterium]|nr:molybdopterin-dependent oxidoreductase [Thermoleophilaceae bacterium]